VGGLNPSLATKATYGFRTKLTKNYCVLLSTPLPEYTVIDVINTAKCTDVNVKNFLGHTGTFFSPDLTL